MVNSRDGLLHGAKLARITLSDDEVQELLPQLNKILDFLEVVRSIPSVDDTAVFATENENEYREDTVRPFDDPDAILSQFPEKKGRYLKVPPNL